jgi:UDP-N-acetylglucosamine 2-epimerase (non-hydrolysing)
MSHDKGLVIYGTRPEEIKLYPFTKYPEFEFLLVDQSRDLHQDLITPNYAVEEEDLEVFIKLRKPKFVMVQGDTRTAFRAALYAFENKIPVIHIEAGLRTFDLTQPFPEEGYRQMIDQIATYKFCSRPEAVSNCGGIYVGQTSIDTLFEFYPKDAKQEYFYIVTCHRWENWERMEEIINFLKNFKGRLHVYAHPNRVGQELKKYFPTLMPSNYKQFINELARCKGIISDSGGLQEEAIALGKEFISLRNKSERDPKDVYKPGATKKIIKHLRCQNIL